MMMIMMMVMKRRIMMMKKMMMVVMMMTLKTIMKQCNTNGKNKLKPPKHKNKYGIDINKVSGSIEVFRIRKCIPSLSTAGKENRL